MSGKINYERGPVCGQENCKSKLYYEEAGFRYCKRGHLQEGVQTQQDEDSFGTQGRKTRVRKETQEKVSQICHGTTAVELYLQAYQLILWKQCHALIHTIGLPAEIETVIKDLWALRLQLLKNKMDAASEEDTVFSSQPQSETETEKEGEDGRREYKMRGKAMPTLIETLGLIYLGMVLLRLPFSMGDIHRWAIQEDIPFIRAIRFVPAIMKQRLPAEYLLALDTTSPLQPDHLRKTIHNLSLFYKHHFKLIFPTLNAHLLLYKHIRDLALPIMLYPLTLSIASLLSIEFSFPSPGRRQRTSSFPELRLICLLVIATKLYHPFSGPLRQARSLADPAALTIDWPSWVAAKKAHDKTLTSGDHLRRGTELNVSEEDAMKMDPKELDEYMDYYERTFIDPERAEQKSRGLPKQLLDMFPTSRFDGSEPTPYSHQDQAEKEQVAAEQTLKTVVGSLKLRPVTSADGDGDEGGYRIGSYYKRYRRVEDLNELARVFYERVALAVGVSLETLVVAVSQVERTLIRFRGKKSKDQGEAEQGCDEEDRDDRGGDEVGEDVEMGNVTEGRDEDFYSD